MTLKEEEEREEQEEVSEGEYSIDSDVNFVSLIHFLHIYSSLLPDLDAQLCLGNTQDFSPVHLRHFFLYCADETLLTRPFTHFLKWINQRQFSPSIFKCLQREYRRRDLDVPPFLEDLGEAALMVTLTIEQRVRLMHDLLCVFIPWNGDAFRELCSNREFSPEHSRLPTFSSLCIVSDRFLYDSNSWTLLAFDKLSWESFFVDADRNPLLKSRKPAAKSALSDLRKLLPDVLEQCRFDEKCHRELELRVLQERRKRSPRVTERFARREALERLGKRRPPVDVPPATPPTKKRNSREDRMAKREQVKVMQQLHLADDDDISNDPEETAEEFESKDEYDDEGEYEVVDDKELMSSSSQVEDEDDDDHEDELINVVSTSSPVKKVILRLNPSNDDEIITADSAPLVSVNDATNEPANSIEVVGTHNGDTTNNLEFMAINQNYIELNKDALNTTKSVQPFLLEPNIDQQPKIEHEQDILMEALLQAAASSDPIRPQRHSE